MAAEPTGSASAGVLHTLLDVHGGKWAGMMALPRLSGDCGSQPGLYGDQDSL